MAKGVEAGRVLAEGDEGAAERLGRVLEGTPVVDHHRLAAGADQPRDQLLHQHRLARAGLAGDGDVVVAGLVGEGRPAGRLTPAPDQEEGRRVVRVGGLAAPLAVQRREVHRRGGQQGLHPAHALEIGVEPAGRDHGQAGQPGGQLHVALGVHPPALAVIDRAHRLFGLVERIERRIDRRHVAGPNQLLAVLDALAHRLPVARLLGQAGQVAGDAGAGLLGRAGRLQERLLAGRHVTGYHGEAGQHRAARLQEVAVEVADQRVAAPTRPDLGEGDRREHPDGDVPTGRAVLAVGMMECEAGGRHGERAAGCDALLVQRIARRPAPRGALGFAVAISGNVGRGEFRHEGQQRVGLQPPGTGPRRGQCPLQRPAERAERGLRGRAGTARQAGGDEHPVVREGEGRPARMQPAPAAGGKQVAAPRTHPRECSAGLPAGFRPGPARRSEARARPVDDLDRAALRRGVGQRARQRTQGLGVDAGKGRQLHYETGGARIHIKLARFVEGAPGQERVQRGRHRRRRPRLRRFRTFEQLQQTGQTAGSHRGSFQPAGASTTRTWDASR